MSKWKMIFKGDAKKHDCPGVYVLYLSSYEDYNEDKIVYIGATVSIKKRIYNNPIISTMFYLLEYPYTVRIKIKLIEEGRLELEKKLISRLKPPLNKTYTRRKAVASKKARRERNIYGTS